MLTPVEREALNDEVEQGTFDLENALDDIATEQKGEGVRRAIYGGIMLANKNGAGGPDLHARNRIADANGRIDAIESEMAQFIASHTGVVEGTRIVEDVLWTGNLYNSNDMAGLYADIYGYDIRTYDYLDIYIKAATKELIYRVTPNALLNDGIQLSATNLTNDLYTTELPLQASEYNLKGTMLNDTLYSVEVTISVWTWSGKAAEASNQIANTSPSRAVTKIVGIKHQAVDASKDSELTDMRIGADGTLYASAGRALRTQISNMAGKVRDLSEYESIFTGNVDESVHNWLDEHPEATTTVQDDSLTDEKFTDALKLKTIKDYVIPEMFGAVGDGVHDDYNAFVSALETNKTVVLCQKTYYCSRSIVLNNDQQIIGTNRKKSIIKFAEDVNAIQLNHSNNISNFTIIFSGNGSALYLYTPDNYAYSLSTTVDNVTLKHNEDEIEGSFIRLVAQKVDDKPYGAYNLTFSNIDCRNAAKYGIEIVNKVSTTSNTECWFTEIKFDSIFFDKVETAFFSDWEDISGNNAVPSTGQASRNGSIKLINVSAQYNADVSENFAIIRNVRDIEFIGCNPFDYYNLPNTQNKPIFILNATADMCSVNLGWMYEFPLYVGIKNRYIVLENSNDYDADFQKIVTYLEIGNGTIYGNFIPFNGVMKSDFSKASNLTSVTSQYGTCRYGYMKIADVVIVSLSITPSSSITIPANTSLLDQLLPEPFVGNSLIPITAKDGTTPVDAYIRYNGELRIGQSVTTSSALTFSGIYIA